MTDLKSIRELASTGQQAVLDLLIMAMYADGHIALSEQEPVSRLLSASGVDGEEFQRDAVNASIQRITRKVGDAKARQEFVGKCSAQLIGTEVRSTVLALLDEISASDGSVDARETEFATEVRAALR